MEASKFTEVGYVGRDVESMIRDLVEIAIDMVREEKLEDVADKAEQNAEERLLDLLLPRFSAGSRRAPELASRCRRNRRRRRPVPTARAKNCASNCAKANSTTASWKSRCASAIFPSFEIISNQGVEEMDVNIKDMLPSIFGQRTKKRAR